jgi:predicted ATPase/DNA-binding winged helix-turn-helix (wHTH) protein
VNQALCLRVPNASMALDTMTAEADTVLFFGPYSLSPKRRLLLKGEDALTIGSRALDVLITLVEAAGAVVDQRQLEATAWPNVVVGAGSLRVTIAGLRKALGDGKDGVRYIANVTGRGYCFVAPISRSVDGPSAPSPLPGPGDSKEHKLPPPLVRILGRSETVEALTALLTTHRFVTVVGTGGMGKTTVAVHVGHAVTETFCGAVYFVDFSAITDPGQVPDAVALTLGATLRLHEPLTGLATFLSDRRALLILDNCEHVIEAAALLAERLYSEAPQIHILATSREALRAEGEHVHLLAPLNYPPPGEQLTAAMALETSAVQLFMERALASGYTTPLNDVDAPIVAHVCRRLDGIPFAVELAASRTASYGLQETAGLLNNRFKLLWQGRRSAPPRQQTLTAMLDWSVNLLSDRDKLVLGRLSLFVGTFSLHAAIAVVSDSRTPKTDVVEAINSLAGKCLLMVQSIDSMIYYRVLEPTIDYALEKLFAPAEIDVASMRHAKYFIDMILEAAPCAVAASGSAPPIGEQHMGNIRSALEWCFSPSGDPALGVRLAAAAAPIFFELSLLSEAQRWCERGLAALPAKGADQTLRLALQSTHTASSMFKLGNSLEIRTSLEDCLGLAESLNNDALQIRLLAGLSIALTRTGEFEDAVAIGWRSLAVGQRIGTPGAIAVSEWMLGVAYHLAGDQAAGQTHLELGCSKAAGLDAADVIYFGYDHRIRGLIALARCLWLRGLPDRAADVARQAISYAVERDHPVDLCISLIYGTTVFLWRSDFGEAEDLITRLMEHATKHTLGPYQTIARGLAGELAVNRGQAEHGNELLRKALEDMKAFRYQTLSSSFQRALASGLLNLGRVDEAASVVDDAITILEGKSEPLDPELLRLRGEIHLKATSQNFALAERSFRQALREAKGQSALSLELRAATDLAKLWSHQGKPGPAAELLASVRARFAQGLEAPDLAAADQLRAALNRSTLSECAKLAHDDRA